MATHKLTIPSALSIISKNCELSEVEFVQVKNCPKINTVICSLARSSPENQRHFIGRFLNGEQWPFDKKIASTLDVYDTVGFNEVTSRLNRALGLLLADGRRWKAGKFSRRSPKAISMALLTLRLITEQSELLLKMLICLSVVDDTNNRQSHKSAKSKDKPRDIDRTDAPGSLGLIAKNVRNVAKLQVAHFPTPAQKQKAIDLTRSIQKAARTTLKTARSLVGRADEYRCVRPRSTPKRRIITHERPDGDAIASAWLAERFLFRDEPVELLFVPREGFFSVYRSGDCLVDVGNTFDPQRHYFDHKPPAFADRFESCAAKLVWNHLLSNGVDVEHLQKLVDAVHAVDARKQQTRYSDEYEWSVKVGFQAAIEKARQKCDHDADLYRSMRRWLDRHSRESQKSHILSKT